MSIAIDSGLVLPKKRGGNSRGTRYPFEQMKVGDSFFAPGMSGLAASAAAAEHARRNQHHDLKYASRAVESDPIHKTHGIRVWRIR